MAVIIERVGQRVYFGGDTYAAKDRIKKLGGHWDGDRRAWWIGAAKEDAAHSLAAEINGIPQAVALGLRGDTPVGMVADKLRDAGRDSEADAIQSGATATKTAEDLSDCRVYAKVEYKGRTYYVIAETKDQTRCRLATLQTDGPVFWADMAACRLLKTYPGREVWDGRRYSGRTVTRYTTLGSLREFVADQRRAEANGVPQCPVCGKRNNNMVHDLETGMTCCRGCADMPAE